MASQQPHRNSTQLSFTPRIKYLIFIFSILFAFTSVTYSISQTYSTRILNKLFHDGIFYGRGFSIFDLVVIFISVSIIMRIRINFSKQRWQEKSIYVASILYIIFITINPNNYSLFAGIPDNITFLLFLHAFILIKDNEQYIHIISKLIKVLSLLFLIRAIMLIFWELLGLGASELWGFSSALMEDDSLYIFSFIGIIFLLNYFFSRKKKYLIYWGIIFMLQLLSFRRAGLFLILLPSLFIFTFYYIRYIRSYNKLVIVLFLLTIIYLLFTGIVPFSDTMKVHFYRNFGAFIPESIAYIPAYDFVENLHADQAQYAINIAIDVLDFWGKGYGPQELDQIDYAGKGIHNAFVQVWMRYGLMAFFYYVFLALLLVLEILSLIKNYRIWGREYFLIKACILLYLVFYFAALWMNSIYLLVETKMVVFRMLLFISLYKITPSNYTLLFSKKKIQNKINI